MNEFKQGDKIKLARRQTPDVRRVFGQSSRTQGLFIAVNAHKIFIPEEQILQVSEDESLALGDMQAEPMPRISTDIVNSEDLNHRFTKVE
jgi:hypothetical protein